MTGKAEKRRPIAVAMLSLLLVGAALVAPVIFGAWDGAPLPASTVQADSRETIALAAPLEILSLPRVTIERGNVGLVGEKAGGSGVSKVFRALVLGGGSDLLLGSAHIVVAGGPATHAAASAPVAEALAPLVSALAGFKFRSLTIVDSTVAIVPSEGGTLTIENVDAEIVTDRSGLVKAKGRIELRGEPIDFDVAFNAPASDARDTPVRIRVDLRGRLVTAAFDGRMTLGEAGLITAENAELSVPNVRKAADWLGIEWPVGRGLALFTAHGALTLRPRALSFEHAQFSLDGNAGSGALTLKIGAERPVIEGTLAFPSFDIAPYLAPAGASALSRASEWFGGLTLPGFSEPSFVRATDADIRVSASNVMNGATRLGRVAASISVKAGKLYGELAELEVDQGGKGESQFTVDMTGAEPLYTVRADLEDIDLATLSAGRISPPAVEGIGDIDLDVSAHGASAADIVASLSGTMSLVMQEGVRLGIDIDALPRAAEAAPPGGWGPAAARTTPLDTLVARFSAANGRLTATSVEAAAADRLVSVTGAVDIDKSDVDLVLSTSRLEAGAAGVATTPGVAYRIRGPWAAPAISPATPSKDARSTAAGANPG